MPGDTVTCLSTVDLCCNLGEIESVPKDVFKGCSHVVHLAAQGSADAPMEGESGVMQRNVVSRLVQLSCERVYCVDVKERNGSWSVLRDCVLLVV